jgi:hypothetical protein
MPETLESEVGINRDADGPGQIPAQQRPRPSGPEACPRIVQPGDQSLLVELISIGCRTNDETRFAARMGLAISRRPLANALPSPVSKLGRSPP